jgi:indolepyruvate ferredoxin oxidoreductase beta subunit
VLPVDGFEIAREAGNVKAANVALVGALSTLLPIPEKVFLAAIEKRVPERFLEVNLRVFKAGRKAGK